MQLTMHVHIVRMKAFISKYGDSDNMFVVGRQKIMTLKKLCEMQKQMNGFFY